MRRKQLQLTRKKLKTGLGILNPKVQFGCLRVAGGTIWEATPTRPEIGT